MAAYSGPGLPSPTTSHGLLDTGANYSAHWAFARIERPTPPAVRNAVWTRNAIDRFVLARLEREGLQPAPPAPPHVLLRRSSLDLTGLPGTLDRAAEFDTAYEQWVDRLLASPRHGERLAWFWLDGLSPRATVFLRHGTAQATKGEKFQIGAIAGQVLGAIVGGTAGSIIAQGSNFGLSTYFLKFSRAFKV